MYTTRHDTATEIETVTMPNTETLLALAEICAAFAGFAALVSVLRPDSDRVADAVHDLLRLRLVISSGVAGVAAALLPVGVAAYGIEADRHAEALYVTALIANICQAGFIFVRFVESTFHHENQLIEGWPSAAGD